MHGSMGQNDWRVQPDNTLQVVNPKAPQRKGLVTEVEEPRKNYRGMFIAWLIIFLVLLAVVISVAIIGVRDPRYVLIGRRLAVQDVVGGAFRSPPFFAAWRGNKLVYKDSTESLMQYNTVENTTKLLFHLSSEEEIWNVDALLSSDGKYVLERRKIRYGLRGATEAQYSLHDVNEGHQFPVLLSRNSLEDPFLQLVLFSPGPGLPRLAAVHSGDIYLLSSVESPDVVRLTSSDGAGRTVLNGVTNWWYRETLLGTPQAMWFSPSGTRLMFVTFNDTELGTVDILTYHRGGHTVIRNMAYPNRNGALTAISISICDVAKTLASKLPQKTKLNMDHLESSWYLTAVDWVNDVTVAVTTMGRDLTSAQVSLCRAPRWHCREVFAAANWRWVSELRPVFSAGHTDFVLQVDDTEEHGTEMVEVLAEGSIKVRHKAWGHRITAVQHWDRKKHRIYYTGVEESRPSQTHLFSRPDSAAPQRGGAVCLTCDLAPLLGRACTAARPTFGRPGGLLALECVEASRRSLHVLGAAVTRQLAVLDTSRGLAAATENVAVPHVLSEMVQFGGEYVRLEVILPALWDEKKGGSYLYPFVLDIEDDVLDLDWSKDLAIFMVSKWDLVFVRVKASAQLSRRSFFGNHKRTSNILSHLSQSYPYLDLDHVAVLGEGFGGHSALVALAGTNQIRCGAVLWPIVELDLYDAYHAERYVDTTNILDAVEMIPDHSLYVVYGTGDPLFLHGDLLSKKLVESGVLFYQQIYSDEDVYLRSVRSHLLRSLEDFLIPNCFPQLTARQEEEL